MATPHRTRLTKFLRACRSRLSPEELGLPTKGRRRASGLCRDEVAFLAGVSVNWYTWLEQARDIKVSVSFLDRLSRALRLNDAEMRHLFDLCRLPMPGHLHSTNFVVSENLKRMVDTVPGPAYLMTTRRWDLVYWNTAVAATCHPLPQQNVNAMELIFLNEHHKSLMQNWEPWARTVVAKFRLDVGSVLAEPDVAGLIEKLTSGSAEFRDWWSEPNVVGIDESPRTYVHSAVGELMFTPAAFVVEHSPGLRLRVFTALNVETAKKVNHLVKKYLQVIEDS